MVQFIGGHGTWYNSAENKEDDLDGKREDPLPKQQKGKQCLNPNNEGGL